MYINPTVVYINPTVVYINPTVVYINPTVVYMHVHTSTTLRGVHNTCIDIQVYSGAVQVPPCKIIINSLLCVAELCMCM